MHKTQVKWDVIRAKLNAALTQYKDSPTTLSKAAGIDFYAARRFLSNGVKSRSNNAFLVCAFFKIEVTKNAQIEDVQIADLHKLLDEVWDGSPPHAALLAKLMESTRPYTVEERGDQG